MLLCHCWNPISTSPSHQTYAPSSNRASLSLWDSPNWRSSSPQQLQILLNLPVSSILCRVSSNHFWQPSWGPQPKDPVPAARRILDDVSPLVPIYQHCYIPSSPNVVGKTVFYVDLGGDVRLVTFDIVGFFWGPEEEPVWAATRARRIRFWSEVVERWWWSSRKGELGKCLEGEVRRLREGGWREEEIHEMMIVKEDEEVKRKEKDSTANPSNLGKTI